MRHGGLVTSLDPHQPFTRAEALAAGVTDRRLRGPAFRRLFTGVYVATDVSVDTRLRARAALRIAPAGALLAGPRPQSSWAAWCRATRGSISGYRLAGCACPGSSRAG